MQEKRSKKQEVRSKVYILSCILFLASCLYANYNSSVYILKFAGPIGPISSEYIVSGIEKAEADNALAVVIKLDTPGGLDESMREIIQKMLSAKLPVITYVSPAGARAASAGVFITLASDIAVMSSSTNIGAAHPVSVGNKEISQEMQEKITNDAASYLVSIAEKRNRNKEWAEQAVRKSVSISADEAVKIKVVDFIADDDASLFVKLDSIFSEKKTIIGSRLAPDSDFDNTGRPFWSSSFKKEIPLNARQRFLLFLTNPNVAYILIMLGIYGLIFELKSPGAIFPGVVGAICLILGAYSLRMLPTNYAGLALIAVAIILFILEIYVTSYGFLAIGGIVSLTLGSFLLFQSTASYFRLAVPVILTTVIVTALFFIWIIGKAVRAHRKKVTTGKEGMLLEIGTAQTDLDTNGIIMIHGELWSAESINGKINKGDKVQVVAVQGMILQVRRSS
jgi:membrane-bound serine protease (ClpP class)